MRIPMRAIRESRRGSVLLIFAVLLLVLMSFAALSVDTGYLIVSKDQLQNSADAAALAAASQFAVPDLDKATNEARFYANANTVAGESVLLNPASDIEFGQIQLTPGEKAVFVAGATPVDSVRVTARRTTGSNNGPMPTFFAGVLGHPTVDVSAMAVASLPAKRVVFVLDRSGSMDDDTPPRKKGQPAPDPQPITNLKNAAISFVDRLQQGKDKIGLVSYSTTPTLDYGLSFDLQRVKTKIASMQADGWTNIAGGIDIGLQQFQAESASCLTVKIMVLLSDGNANWPNPNTAKQCALDKAQQCAAAGIKVFTISLGTEADRDLMERIARMTQAATFYAQTGDDLPAAFNTIFERIPPRLSM